MLGLRPCEAILAAALAAAVPACASANPVEVTFPSGGVTLAGAVYVPDHGKPVAAVVVLGGSDRGARGPMKEALARRLATDGVVALVYDSPGTGRSGGNAMFQTRLDRAREVVDAVRFLGSFGGIGSAPVGVWGGSEGARVALLAAGLDPDIPFAVAVSGGFGVSSLDLARFRIEAMGLRRGLGSEDIERAKVLEDVLFTLMSGRDVTEWRLVRARIQRWPDEPWNDLVGAVRACREDSSGADREAAWNKLRNILQDWKNKPWFEVAVVDRNSLDRVLALDATGFFALLRRGSLAREDWYDRREELDLLYRVRCPVLAVWGEEDDFLPAHRCAAWLAANLQAAGNEDVTCRILPRRDHFLAGDGVSAPGYPEFFADWLATRFPPDPGR